MTKIEEWYNKWYKNPGNAKKVKSAQERFPSREEIYELENDLGEHIMYLKDGELKNMLWAVHTFITDLNEAREELENKLAVAQLPSSG